MNGPIIVAEMACAHEGSIEKIFKLIDAAVKAKVDVIQFQFFQVDENALPGDPNHELGSKLEIPLDKYEDIFARSRKNNLRVWATVADVVSAKNAFLFKPELWRIHSSDINNFTLINYLCTTNIPISIAVGGSTLEEIEFAVDAIKRNKGEIKLLVHGFQGYPTPIEEENISFIKTLKENFNVMVGYQDHTDGDDPLGFLLPAMALCYGAEVIEKHFTFDRSLRGIDYHASLNPEELARFTDQIKRSSLAIGQMGERVFGPLELEYRKNFKKGLVFRRNLSEGEEINFEDVKMVRVKGIEIYGNEIHKVIGKKLNSNVIKNEIVQWEMIK